MLDAFVLVPREADATSRWLERCRGFRAYADDGHLVGIVVSGACGGWLAIETDGACVEVDARAVVAVSPRDERILLGSSALR